jgi:hypothetical protein
VVIKKCPVVVESSPDEFRDASLSGCELGSRGIELGRVFGNDSNKIMARKELSYEKKTSCVILNDSETVVTSFPGCDY